MAVESIESRWKLIRGQTSVLKEYLSRREFHERPFPALRTTYSCTILRKQHDRLFQKTLHTHPVLHPAYVAGPCLAVSPGGAAVGDHFSVIQPGHGQSGSP